MQLFNPVLKPNSDIELIDSLVGVPWKEDGRDFAGVDCVGICDLFLRQSGIKTIAPKRSDAKRMEPEALRKKIEEHAYIVPAGDLLIKGDIMVFLIEKELHVAVYLGHKRMLHAQEGERSRISRLSPAWGKLFRFGLRPKNGTLYVPPAGPPAAVAIAGGMIGGMLSFSAATATFWSVAWGTIQGIAIGYSVGLALEARHATQNASSPNYSFGALENTTTNQIPFPRIYGQIRMAGNIIYQNPPEGGAVVDLLVTLGEGEIQGVSQVQLNDIDIAEFPGCTYTAFLGTATQNVETDTGLDLGGVQYRHRALLHVHLETSDKLSSRPTITCLIQGLKVQTWDGNNWSTAKTYSKNTAACIRDYALTARQRGGCGYAVNIIDSDSFGEAYEDCAALVATEDGGTEPRYEIGYTLDQRRSSRDYLTEMMAGIGAIMYRSGSVLKLKVSKAQSATLSFTEAENIAANSFEIFPKDVDEKINKLSIEYCDPDQNDIMVAVPCAQDRADQLARGLFPKVFTIPSITRQSQALRIGYQYFYEEKLNPLMGRMTVDMTCGEAEPGTVAKVTHSLMNWVEQRVTILNIVELSIGSYQIVFQQFNASCYNDRWGAPIQLFNYGTPANPYAPVTEVANLSTVESDYYFHKDGSAASDIIVSWTPPADDSRRFLGNYQVEIKKKTDDVYGDYVVAGTPQAGETGFRIMGVEETDYIVRIKTVSINKIISDGAVSAEITILGKSQKPPTPTGFDVSQHGDRLILKVDKSTQPDFGFFKFRKTRGTWDDGDNIEGERIDATKMEYPVGEIGELNFMVKEVDRSGNESDAPAIDTLTVTKPPEMNFINAYDLWAENLEYKHTDTAIIMRNYYDAGYARKVIALRTATSWEQREAEGLTWEAQEAAGGLELDRPVASSGSFEITKQIDIGTVVTFNLITDVDYENIDGGSVTVQVSYSEDGVTWSSFADVNALTLYTARYLKFKFLLATTNTDHNVYFWGCTIYVNAPVTKVDWGGDLAVPSGGVDIYYKQEFTYPPRIIANISNGVAGFIKITKDGATPPVKWNARVYSDQALTTPIDTAEIDWDAKGN